MRVKGGFRRRRRHKRLLSYVKGYVGSRRLMYRQAMETLRRALTNAFHGRRLKKRQFRRLWIARISAASKANGISYSRLIDGLNKARCQLNRKVLADLAICDPTAFGALVTLAKSHTRTK